MKIAFTTKKTGTTVLFNNISLVPANTTWSWSFGDGEKSTEKAVFVSNPDRNNGKSFWVPKSQCHKIA